MVERLGASPPTRWIAVVTLCVLVACQPGNEWGDPDGDPPGDTDPGDGGSAADADGDGISDRNEGRLEGTDTDGDGTPDYQDADSDDDGIADAIEAGNGNNPDRPPVDSDLDGTPDFRDYDSDNNGVFDTSEGGADFDNDLTPDHADFDNDGDGIGDRDEIGDNPSVPTDTDGDGTPDYYDTDSDGDTIEDRHESITDTDRDGLPDYVDLDSDDDGLNDAEEAGDADPSTAPVDTDGDLIADFRDPDSDNDGLSDAHELASGTDPTDEDSDDDGVTDLVEVAAETDPLSADDSPRTRGDFFFFVPYQEDPEPAQDTLSFATDIQFADVYFLMDTTGSMGGEITTLRSSLSGTVIPGILGAIPDVYFGVGGFDDYPYGGYGDPSSGDRAYYHLQSMTDSAAAAQSAVNSLITHYGVDEPESHVPALHAVATGCGDGSIPDDPGGACGDRTIYGYPHFRPGAVPIIVLMTDATMHNGPGGANAYGGIPGVTPPTYAQTVAALTEIHARVIGVNSGLGGGHLTQLANDTGTVGAGGPLVYNIGSDGSGLGSQVVQAVQDLAQGVPMNISARAVDDPSDDVDATVFISAIVPSTSAAEPCATGLTVSGDTFVGVLPGTTVCFDIIAARNETVEPTTEPSVYTANIQVWGDDVTMLDERDVYFLVPPVIEDPGGPD